jgi:hypothetical protein
MIWQLDVDCGGLSLTLTPPNRQLAVSGFRYLVRNAKPVR